MTSVSTPNTNGLIGLDGLSKTTGLLSAAGIREVWASNLEEEFRLVRRVAKSFPFVAMDTEFPGVVARPLGEFKSREDYQYQLLRCNVDLLKLIQVGLTFMNEKGELPSDYSTWQFNFKFNLAEDMYAQDSVELLQKSGIMFKKLDEDGIEVQDFAELLMTSGLVLCDNITWLSFHSGYDFGYLVKILTNKKLSDDQGEFFELLKLFFPNIYDIKTVLKHTIEATQLVGGLQEIAEQLHVERIGPRHQAGSDSLLTGTTFFKIKENFFEDQWRPRLGTMEGFLYGLGSSSPCGSVVNAGNGNNSAVPYDQVTPTPGTRGGVIEGANAVNVPPGLDGATERDSSGTSSATQDSLDSEHDSARPPPADSSQDPIASPASSQ